VSGYNGVLEYDYRRCGAVGLGRAVGYQELGTDGGFLEEVAMGCKRVSRADELYQRLAGETRRETYISLYLRISKRNEMMIHAIYARRTGAESLIHTKLPGRTLKTSKKYIIHYTAILQKENY
jgi:hypothetical protein